MSVEEGMSIWMNNTVWGIVHGSCSDKQTSGTYCETTHVNVKSVQLFKFSSEIHSNIYVAHKSLYYW